MRLRQTLITGALVLALAISLLLQTHFYITDTDDFLRIELAYQGVFDSSYWLLRWLPLYLIYDLLSEPMDAQTMIRQSSKRVILLKALRRKFSFSAIVTLGIFAYFVLRIVFLTGRMKLGLIVVVFLVLLMNDLLTLLFLLLSEFLQLFRFNHALANFGLWFIVLFYCFGFRKDLPFSSDFLELFIKTGGLELPVIEIFQYLALLAGIVLVTLYFSDRVEKYD